MIIKLMITKVKIILLAYLKFLTELKMSTAINKIKV